MFIGLHDQLYLKLFKAHQVFLQSVEQALHKFALIKKLTGSLTYTDYIFIYTLVSLMKKH